jgi:hypothetical protein
MNIIAKALLPVGLVDNNGKPYNCGHCEYLCTETKAFCRNTHPKLRDRRVEKEWCCNLFDHPGMRTIIK